MSPKPRPWLALVAVLALLAAGRALALDGFHSSREDGLAAAQKTGKPILVVTAWRDGL